MKTQVLTLPKPAKWSRHLDKTGKQIRGYSVYLPNGTIHYRQNFKKLGIPPLHVATGVTGLGRAKTIVELAIQKHRNKHLGIDDRHVFTGQKGKAFNWVCSEFLVKETPKAGRWRTQVKHKFFLGELSDYFSTVSVDRITTDCLDGFIADKKVAQKNKKGRKRTKFFDYAKHMNLVMRYAYEKKYTTHLLTYSVDEKNEKQRVYTNDEIKRLWENGSEEFKDQFILSYECFMRYREVLNLPWEYVNSKTGLISLPASFVKTGSKTGKGRDFIVSRGALKRLRRRFKKTGNTPFVFPSPKDPTRSVDSNRGAWRTAKKLSGITGKATWHSLRHTALTEALIIKKQNPVLVSEYAGVSLATIQRVYLHSKAEHTKEINEAVRIEG